MTKDTTCIHCNGTGLIRTDDPYSDRIYGGSCSSCNGTGIRATHQWVLLVLLVVSAIATIAPLIWWLS